MKKVMLVALIAFALPALSAMYPMNVGLCPGVQIVDADQDDVCCFQLSLLWGACQNMEGLSVALGGDIAHQTMSGFSWALGFHDCKDGNGVLIAYGFNRASGDFNGVESSYGANFCQGTLKGCQTAIGFSGAHEFDGVQFGCLTRTYDGCGVQVGIVNIADDLQGVQIGIVNIIKVSPVSFFPIVNAKF